MCEPVKDELMDLVRNNKTCTVDYILFSSTGITQLSGSIFLEVSDKHNNKNEIWSPNWYEDNLKHTLSPINI